MTKKTKTKFPKIEIKQRKNSKSNIMTGANTVVLVDGKPIVGCTKASFEVEANGVAKVTLELLGQMHAKGVIGKYTKVYLKN